MGLIYANIAISNPIESNLEKLDALALVDTGALHLCVPEHIAFQLKLKELEKREVVLAYGKSQICSYVGPVKIQFENRSCFTGALVLGDSVLLGAIPLEDMDLIIHPATLKLSANPKNPNIPLSVVK